MKDDGGTVLRVGSHRADNRLAYALGRQPAKYYTWQHGGVFVVLYSQAEVDTALEITSVRRTRTTMAELGLCASYRQQWDQRTRRCADLWDGAVR